MRYRFGQVLLASMWFTGQGGFKKRPVVVLRDAGDNDLLVAPVTSQAARVRHDTVVAQWQAAGLLLPSIVRAEKLATIEKAIVVKTFGFLVAEDIARLKVALKIVFDEVGSG